MSVWGGGGQVRTTWLELSKGRHSRHSQANDLIKRALPSAQVPALREPPGLSRQDGKRPDGLTLLPWAQGRSLVWDFTCSDTVAPSHINQTSQEAGRAAAQAEKKKLMHYEALAASGFTVMPVAVETLGGIHIVRTISWGRRGFVKIVHSK